MSTLDEGIKGLDDLDTFFEYLNQVGASHRRIPGFKADYFWVRLTWTRQQSLVTEVMHLEHQLYLHFQRKTLKYWIILNDLDCVRATR